MWHCSDAEITFEHTYIHIENTLNWNNISQFYCFYYIFDQINAALVSRSDFKTKKIS